MPRRSPDPVTTALFTARTLNEFATKLESESDPVAAQVRLALIGTAKLLQVAPGEISIDETVALLELMVFRLDQLRS